MSAPKKITMNIRVSEDEIMRIRQAAELAEYSSFSEFVRRTSLAEASRVLRVRSDGKKPLETDSAKGDSR